MTQVEAPNASRADAPEPGRISHWIGGRIVAGTVGPRGPGLRPGDRPVWRSTSTSPRPTRSTRRSPRRRRPSRAGARRRSRSGPTSCSGSGTWSRRTARRSRRYLTAEHGKVPSDALGEIARGLENLEFACGIPNLLKGGFTEQVSTGVDVYQIRQPLGVVAGITPFNFPAMVPMWMFATAIATRQHVHPQAVGEGPVRVELPRRAARTRPASRTASSTSSTATRSRSTRSSTTRTSPPSRSSGSTPIARYIYETGTKAGKRVQALGGAKNHMIVLPDADIDMAADAAVSAGYGSAGERCMAIATIVAVGDVADPLVEAIKARLPKIKVGPGQRSDVGDGPARHAGSIATRSRRTSTAARPRARRSSPTAASTRSTTSRTGSSWASR